jgi:hypothetical protein
MIWEVDETLDSTVGWDEFSLAYRYAVHERTLWEHLRCKQRNGKIPRNV